ncbi:hypothetical protein [Cyanobium sp. ATX 6F1]|uniref:hypothetical protein n=1 Tax=unclassified Cyanobium TaxID=2627006 RepID=UPI0020CBD1B0|nr:hypothetical protein [Cyanobium sp. ATX 6F1]MCP9915328.1 hypothetical protein [Cyanobium sp. ATX 6F1]
MLRSALAHSIAVIWFACLLTYEAGFTAGYAARRIKPPAKAAADRPDPQQEAAFSGWEAEVAAGRWVEPKPVEPICPGSWWDLIDPSELDEADLELPLRWAV